MMNRREKQDLDMDEELREKFGEITGYNDDAQRGSNDPDNIVQ